MEAVLREKGTLEAGDRVMMWRYTLSKPTTRPAGVNVFPPFLKQSAVAMALLDIFHLSLDLFCSNSRGKNGLVAVLPRQRLKSSSSSFYI